MQIELDARMQRPDNNDIDRCDEVLAEYFLRIDRGEAVDQEQFIAEYAEVRRAAILLRRQRDHRPDILFFVQPLLDVARRSAIGQAAPFREGIARTPSRKRCQSALTGIAWSDFWAPAVLGASILLTTTYCIARLQSRCPTQAGLPRQKTWKSM